MRLDERYEKRGSFWICGEEEKQVPGVLRIEDGGKVELEIFDVLGGFQDQWFDMIVGVIEGNEYVTLLDCFYTRKSIPLGGVSQSYLHVYKVLEGVGLEEEDSVEVNFLSFSTDCMDEWVGVCGMEVDTARGSSLIKYQQPEKIVHYLNNGMKLEIRFEYKIPGASSLTKVEVEQRAIFALSTESPIALDDFVEVAHKIVNLLGFAVDDTVSFKKMSASSKRFMMDYGGGEKVEAPIRIYYQSLPYSERVPKKHWRQMLFSYREISSNAQDIFNNWLDSYYDLAPAFRLYFATKTGAQKYLEGKFLALAQDLETYHRRISDERFMDEGDFDRMVGEILESCPDEHKEWLSGRMCFGNEISLRRRLKLIIKPFVKYFGNSAEREDLVGKIVATRNYLTHYNEEIKGRAEGGRELADACEKMEAIFQLHFLRVIGLTSGEIDEVVKNSSFLKGKVREPS